MKKKYLKVLMSVVAVSFLGASALFNSSCATDQGHGSQGFRDSQTAVDPAWQRALKRTRH